MNIKGLLNRLTIITLVLSVLTGCSIQKGIPGTGDNTIKPTEQPSASPIVEPTPDMSTIPNPTAVPKVEPVTMPLNKLKSEFFSPILGLCEDYPRGTSVETIEKDFALMAQYGISDIRVSIAWGDYEPRKGHSNWSLLDSKVELAEKYGIELYPYICYSPGWATGADWKSPPEDLQDWYDFVYTVVDRYKGRISHWELWNEGDNADFWSGTWQEQLELVKTGAKAVKDANSDAITVFGGLTKTSPSHVNTIYTSGTAEYIDVINIHFYSETWNPSPTENIHGIAKYVADIIRRYGGKQELWVAEIGYSDYVQANGQVSYWVKKNAPYEKTKEFQAVTFIRSYSLLAATEDISNILWYEIKNLRLDSAAIGDVNNYFLGALDHNYFPKHLWFAIASTKQLFNAPFMSIDDQLTIDASNAKKPYVHGFLRENGDAVIIAWNRGTENESINVTIPGEFRNALKYSATGEKTSFKFESSDNSATLSLDLIPESVNIIELFAEDIPARLTIDNPEVTKRSGNRYMVSAVVTNIGGLTATDLTSEIFVNESLAINQEAIYTLKDIAPGEQVTVSWDVTVNEIEAVPQLWLAVNPKDSAPAAMLIELP